MLIWRSSLIASITHILHPPPTETHRLMLESSGLYGRRNSGIMSDGVVLERYQGTPQGGCCRRCWPM